MGYISEGERSTVKQQWKICHNFHDWIIQDLPHLTQFECNRLQNRHTALYSHYRKIEDVKSGGVLSGFEPMTLCSKQRFVVPLANNDYGLVFPAFPVPWQSGWVVGRMHRYLSKFVGMLKWLMRHGGVVRAVACIARGPGFDPSSFKCFPFYLWTSGFRIEMDLCIKCTHLPFREDVLKSKIPIKII